MARPKAFNLDQPGYPRGLAKLQAFAGGSNSKEAQYLQHLATADVVYWKDDFQCKVINVTHDWTLTNA